MPRGPVAQIASDVLTHFPHFQVCNAFAKVYVSTGQATCTQLSSHQDGAVYQHRVLVKINSSGANSTVAFSEGRLSKAECDQLKWDLVIPSGGFYSGDRAVVRLPYWRRTTHTTYIMASARLQ